LSYSPATPARRLSRPILPEDPPLAQGELRPDARRPGLALTGRVPSAIVAASPDSSEQAASSSPRWGEGEGRCSEPASTLTPTLSLEWRGG